MAHLRELPDQHSPWYVDVTVVALLIACRGIEQSEAFDGETVRYLPTAFAVIRTRLQSGSASASSAESAVLWE